ncbi:MAG: T9SS type A sorting domain-containing protein [Flavobacteriales bacterium]|nr:T9SS type A sorting domain-containing protein [Flavobacteriales bacterium]
MMIVKFDSMKNMVLPTLVMFITFLMLANGLVGQDACAWQDVVNEDFKIVASDGSVDDGFAHSISIDNGIIAVGSPFDDDNGSNSGSAYLFDASTGVELAKLLPSDGAANEEFGFSIAIDNGIVAVGAKGDNENGTNAGAAYLFDASTGVQLHKLLPNDGASGDEFGNSIAIDNGIVAVGAWRADEFGDASGAAYLFDVSSGNQLEKVLPNTGNNFQTFGVSIAIDGDILAIGARTYFVLGEGFNFARAYLFDVQTGDQINILQPNILNLNGDLGGFFADCIDINDGLVAVGAPNRSVVFDHSGAAYVFDASTGSQLQYIVPEDAHDRDNFGISISIDNGTVLVGAHQDDDNGFNSGSAYFYDALSGAELNKIIASDGAAADLYGNAVALDGNFAVVGAIDDDDNGAQSGSAYIYSGACLDCAVFEMAPTDLTKSFDPVNGVEDRVQLKFFKASPQVAYASEDSAACDILFWPKRFLDSETGQVVGDPIQDPDSILLSQVQKMNNNPLFKWPVKYRADGANNAKRVDPNIRYQWKVRCYCQKGIGPVSPWSATKIFNTPDFDPSTGVNTGGIQTRDNSGFKTVTNTFKVDLYPNPTEGVLNLNYKTRKGDASTIMVMDMFGKVIYTEVILGSGDMMNIQLDMSDLSIGNYILSIHNELQITTERFIVTR